jgi:hypothetical protein
MIWGVDLDFSAIPKPASQVWVGHGKTPVALLRSDWSNPDGLYVGLKGGSPSTAHAHMDIGSFVMDALGERWAMDFGSQDYYSIESKGIKLFDLKQESGRWKVFRISNLSHNTLTFNKGLQKADASAPILSYTDHPSFRSATVDLTPIYPGDARKVRRGVAIVNDQYVLIRDEIELKIPSLIRWNMLTDADVVILDDKTAELRKKGKKLLLRINEPSDAVFTTWSTDPPQSFDAPNPGTILIGFEVRKKPSENVTISVEMIPQETVLESKMAIPLLSEWPSFIKTN